MMKRWTAIFLCLVLLFSFPCTAYADTDTYIADHAGLLYSEEILQLENQAADLASRYGIDPVILTVDSLGGVSAQEYADDYYDHMGYREDGILFLLAMEEREWYISTCGSVIYAVTDYGVQQLGESVVPYLSSGLWYEGFSIFLTSLPEFLDAYEAGAPMDGYADYSGDYYHGQQDEVVYYEESSPNFLLSLLCGLAAAGISLWVMRSSMNTKRTQRSAGDYLKRGSWNLYQHRDLFLYSNVTKTRRQEPKPASGGGSSVHRSSGGRSHGGGGGKF